MNETDAKAALREQGIRNPSKALIDNWLRAVQYEHERAPEPAPPAAVESPRFHPSSESTLEPLLRERGQLERGHPRKPGRPRILAPWFQAVATVMADGTPLRTALASVGIYGLTERQIRSLYRNRAFQALYQEARRKWLAEWGISYKRALRRTPTCRPKGRRGPDSPGMDWKFRRTL